MTDFWWQFYHPQGRNSIFNDYTLGFQLFWCSKCSAPGVENTLVTKHFFHKILMIIMEFTCISTIFYHNFAHHRIFWEVGIRSIIGCLITHQLMRIMTLTLPKWGLIRLNLIMTVILMKPIWVFINYLYHFWLFVESSIFTHISHVLTLFEDNGEFISLPLSF